MRRLRGCAERGEPPTPKVETLRSVRSVSRSDDHWLGRLVLIIGVAMSSATVALLIMLLIGGR